MQLQNAYLLIYNLCQTVGWAVVFYRILTALAATQTISSAYAASGATVCIFQLAAAAEILHALTGLVKGSPLMALMQWAGRSNVLFSVIRAVPEVQTSIPVGLMLLAWALSEVIRYPWYAANIAGASPFWLTWLRYTAFIPLYPVGVFGEMKAMYDALPYLKERRLHSIGMPNSWNFAFDYHIFLMVLLIVYPFLWWQLYSTLLIQRKKRLNPSAASSKKNN